MKFLSKSTIEIGTFNQPLKIENFGTGETNLMDQKYIDRALYLINNGYVTGVEASDLADKLHTIDNSNTKYPSDVLTREKVYGEENAELIKNIVDETAPEKKFLVTPGERTSAALDEVENG